MASEEGVIRNNSSADPKNPAMNSCRKKKKDDASFLEDVKDHIDEFINASMEDHKTCFTKTIKKMFGMSKIVAERNTEAKEVEVSLPPQPEAKESKEVKVSLPLQTEGKEVEVSLPLYTKVEVEVSLPPQPEAKESKEVKVSLPLQT